MLVQKSIDVTVQKMQEEFGNDKSLRLLTDVQPLAGRVLTVDGTPVANASIRVNAVRSSKTGSLDQWEKAAADNKADYNSLNRTVDGMYGLESSSILQVSTTDSDGRFTLSGIGKERIVEIFISGPGIETAPNHIYPKDFQFLKQLQIEKNETDLELSIELSSGMSLNVRVVKSNGEPVPNAILNGTAEFSGWDSIRDGSLKIEGYYADQGRELFAYDPDSRQAAHVQLTGSQLRRVVLRMLADPENQLS